MSSKVDLKMRPLPVACSIYKVEINGKGDTDEITLYLSTPLFKKVKRFVVVVKVPRGKGKKLVNKMVNTTLMWDEF